MVDMQVEHERLTGEAMLSEDEIVRRAQHRVIFSGVYFLVKDGRVVYVGKSINVEQRIAQHRKTKDFDTFTYVQAFGDQLDMLESMYIHHFQPEQNAWRGGKIVAPLMPYDIASCAVPLKALTSLPTLPPKDEKMPEATLNLEGLEDL